MHPDHPALVERLRSRARPTSHGRFDPSGYLGSDHAVLNVSVPDRRAIAKAWIAAHKDAAPAEVLALAASLFDGPSHEEKTLAALLLAAHRKARAVAGAEDVDRWLDRLAGWAEVDTLCQNVFPAEQLLADWPAWRGLIRRLAEDANINRRRAALVLLVGPAARSDDPRLRELAFETIDRLKPERAILITKAVSWLLRAMTARHAAAVRAYLQANAAALPAIAVRETRSKLETGRKAAP
jgi:3-methyladenine DNA glycosylase AlkD